MIVQENHFQRFDAGAAEQMPPGYGNRLFRITRFQQRQHEFPGNAEQLFAAAAVFEQFAELAAGIVEAAPQQHDLMFEQ